MDSTSDSTNRLNLRLNDLLGIIVWLQTVGDVKKEQYAAAMHFFLTRNPQSAELLQTIKTNPKHIQVGIVEIDKPKDQFIADAIEAANKQAKKLDPCVLVVQQGLLQTANLPINHFYVMGSFFVGPKSTTVIPQPSTQIVLEY